MSALDVGCRAALVVVFVLAVASKIRGRRSFDEFVRALGGFGFPAPLVGAPMAALVILCEALAVASLIAWPVVGYPAAAALLVGFTAVIAAVLARGATVRCRCFGATDAPVGAAHLVRNTVLLGLAAAGGCARLFDSSASAPATLAVVATAGALAGFLASRLDDLLFVFGSDSSRRQRRT